MDLTVTIRNKRNDSLSQVSAELWEKKKNLPQWKTVFEVVNTVKEPPEVTALKAEPAKVEEVKVEVVTPVEPEVKAIEPPAAPEPPKPKAKRAATPRKKAEKK